MSLLRDNASDDELVLGKGADIPLPKQIAIWIDVISSYTIFQSSKSNTIRF